MWVFCLHLHLCITCTPGALGDQNRVLDFCKKSYRQYWITIGILGIELWCTETEGQPVFVAVESSRYPLSLVVFLFFSPSSRIFIVCWRFPPNPLAMPAFIVYFNVTPDIKGVSYLRLWPTQGQNLLLSYTGSGSVILQQSVVWSH